MPLVIIDRSRKNDPRPAFLCDHCGREIVGEGNYHSHSMIQGTDTRTVYFSHKSDCALHVDRRFKTLTCWELDDFLKGLARSLNCTVKFSKVESP